MSGPEQAAPVTPGQAAYEAWCGSFPGGYLSWFELDGELRAAWETAAHVAISRYLLAEYRAARARNPWPSVLGPQPEPAVVTAGTEHLAEKIRGLAIPDEES